MKRRLASPRRSGLLLIFAIIFGVAFMVLTVMDQQARRVGADDVARPVMRTIDPALLEQGVRDGKLSDHEARFYRALTEVPAAEEAAP